MKTSGGKTSSSAGARILLIFGGIAISLAYSGWIATHTILDAHATPAVAHAVISTDAVQHYLGDETGKQLAQELGKQADSPKVEAAVEQAIHDPRVVSAFSLAL